MKYRIATKEYRDNLKPGDKVWVKVEKYPKDVAYGGVFVGKTPTGKLSIQYKNNKDWLNGDGTRLKRYDAWHSLQFTLIEVKDDNK